MSTNEDSSYKPFDRLSEQERHERRIGWFVAEMQRQSVNRVNMARCEAYYDSEQISAEYREQLRQRGQNPVVVNEIFANINWLIGTERRNRVDFHVMPADVLDAQTTQESEAKNKLLKWLDVTNKTGFDRSEAWAQAMKAGIGWMEVGVRGDPEDVPVYSRMENWRNVLWDSMCTRLDIQDARYVFRIKIVDLDLAIAYFPEKEAELVKARTRGDDRQVFASWMMGMGGMNLDLLDGTEDPTDVARASAPLDLFNPRERVMLVECWCKEPQKQQRPEGAASTYDRALMKMRCSIMTEQDTIYEEWSPYKHNRFPFVPKWAYRNSRTGLPYSPVKPLLDKQDALNEAVNKSLFEISVNQVIAEKSAIATDIMDLNAVSDELATPDGVVLLADGALSGQRFQTRRGIENAQAQLQLADRFITAMQNESSVTAENRGMESRAISGKAIGLKQDQGGVLSTELFDKDLLSRQIEGELTLSLVEQYMVKPLVVSVPGERKQSEMLEINKPMDDGTVLNDITARQSRFVVGEQAWKQNLGMAAFESMMDLLGKLAPVAPQVVTSILDIVFEYADLPNKETLLRRIREATGQPGPDNQQTPEQQAATQQKAALAQAQFEANLETLKASVAKLQAEGAKVQADTVLAKLTALYESAQAAAILAAQPAITPVADELLASAGFVDENAPQPVIDAQAPQPVPAVPGVPGQQPPPLQQADGATVGAQAGIGTPNAPSGAPQGVTP
jgi:hypothetical protein